MRADVRIRIRGSVIRIRISEACIRTVIRVTAEQNPTRVINLCVISYLSQALREGCALRIAFRDKAKARAEVRIRRRGSATRTRRSEARRRTAIRATAEQNPTEDFA